MKTALYIFSLVVFIFTNTSAQWVNSGPDYGNDKIVQNGSRIYVLNTRLYHSDDNGASWELENTPAVTFLDLEFINGNIIAATDKGLLLSYDNGLNWVSHNTGVINTDSTQSIRDLEVQGNRVLAIGTSRVYYSDNDGATWSFSNLVNNGRILAVLNNTIFLATTTGIWSSTDNGVSYSATLNSGISGANPNIKAIVNNNNNLYCHKVGGIEVYKSSDEGVTWQLTNSGLAGTIVSASVLTQANGKLFFATGNGVFEFSDISSNWSISGVNTNANPYRIIQHNESKYFALNLEYNLISTTDNGITWVNSASGLRMIGMAPKISNNKLFGFTATGLFQFNELTGNWSKFTQYLYDFGGSVVSFLDGAIYCISYGAGNQYYLGTNGGVWNSNDNGLTWQQHHIGLPITNTTAGYKTVKDLYINGNVIVAATSAGIYRSVDQANTWTQVSTLNTNDLQQYGSYLYATGNGVFRSNDNGLTWAAFAGATSGGPFTYITGANGKLFTSTDASSTPGNTLYADTLASSFTSMTTNIGGAFGYGDFLFYSKFYLNVALSLTNQVDMTDNLPCYYASQALGCIETYLNRNVVYGDNLWLGTGGFSTWYRSLGDFGFPVTTPEITTAAQEIMLYPNPVNDRIYFKDLAANSIVNIYNHLGQVEQTTTYQNNEGIDVSNLAYGFYFYSISNKTHNTTTGKFVKQ